MSFADLTAALKEISETWSPFDFMLAAKHVDLFLLGLRNTILLLVGSLCLASLLAIPLAAVRAARTPIFNTCVLAYTYLFRGTPLLVQVYMLYYGAAQFAFVRDSFLWTVLREPWWCAFICMILCSGAYITEVFRGAIEAVPRGEIEAAKACGMSEAKLFRRITLPNAFRSALPAYANEVIFSAHATVIASTITIVDILGAAKHFNNKYYLAFDGFIIAAGLYMLIVYAITRGFRFWEGKWHRHLSRVHA
ncbi:ABC transporter permease subunit [Mesorhizobium sp. 1M-11]|uniref:ABC transporter permease n=1 Tax=Mesorhizobium sp. 1M-11 TaxID=1529006 RepID=UPI0006C73C35|nr:ABC transporter permease subunit [Mesorhizobium sp. 1M-11]